MCVLIWSAATAKKESRKLGAISSQKRERESRRVSFSSLLKHPAENCRFPQIERSDRCEIWSAGSQQLGESFVRLDGDFEIRRSGFRTVLHSSNYLVISSHLCYFDSIHLDVLISKCMMILYTSSII